MKNNLMITALLLLAVMALAACSPRAAEPVQAHEQTTENEQPVSGLANPAAVHCKEQGHTYETRTAEDGSQFGVCILADGTTCDAWAFFRNECGTREPAPVVDDEPTAENVTDATSATIQAVAWYGRVESLPAGAMGDDYLLVLPEGTAEVGLLGSNEEIETAIVALRDKPEPSRNAHFWGTLSCGVDDHNDCQLVVERLRPDGPGDMFAPDLVEGWQGIIYSGQPGLQVDDYFYLLGDYGLRYGIWSGEPAVAEQLENLRDSNTVIKVWGQLIAGIPDGNGTQIQVERFEVVADWDGSLPLAPEWPTQDDGRVVYENTELNYQLRIPAGATVGVSGVEGFPTTEKPADMSDDAFLAQLQEQLPAALCVRIEYGLGYVAISAPANKEFRYNICGRTGVGAGEMIARNNEITIDGKAYLAEGFEFIGDWEPCDDLSCHNETLVVMLDDGTRIEYGSRPDPSGSFEDYTIKGQAIMQQIVASYQVIQ